MAYALPRSCNADLWAGMTDGAYKKGAMHRGGAEVEHITCHVRGCMSGVWHGFNEADPKMLPDGRTVRTPYTMSDMIAKDMENV